MAYRHNESLHKHKRRASRLRRVAFSLSAVTVLLFLVVGVDWFLSQRSTSNTVVSRENTTSVQSASVSVYRTEFFQFQAPEEWVAVASESTPTKFVYVKNKGPLITQRFVVYINRPANNREVDLKTTRVLPVRIGELGNIVQDGTVSDHCRESWPPGVLKNPTRIVHATVSFVCTPDSVQYNVVIGEIDGDEDLQFTLSDGRNITITATFSDLTAYPGTGDLYNIVSSFSIL